VVENGTMKNITRICRKAAHLYYDRPLIWAQRPLPDAQGRGDTTIKSHRPRDSAGQLTCFYMKVFLNSLTSEGSGALLVLSVVFASLSACSSISLVKGSTGQSTLETQTQEVEKLRSAEYQDYMRAMSFEDSNQKLGNYYAAKGAQVHSLIDQMEKGHEINYDQIGRALDNSDAEKYDDRPPVPLDDETGNGY
jgi:hypothetical protein